MRKHLYKFDQNYRTLTNDMDPIPSTSKQAEITIQFFTSGSDGKFMVIEVNEQSQIKTIKKIIAEKWKIPPENQLYKNKSDLKVMKDSDTVYGLEYLILEQIKEESDANTSDEIDEIPSSGSEKRMKLEEEERWIKEYFLTNFGITDRN